jgi:hypothetical protein
MGAQRIADVEMFTFDCEIHVRIFSDDPFGLAGMEPVANDRPRHLKMARARYPVKIRDGA